MRFIASDEPILWNLQSANNTSYPDTGLLSNGWKTIALLGTGTLIVTTVLGNAMTLYAVCKIKTFQNSITNLYIASLASADMIVGSFVMTIMMLYTIAYDGRWTFGHLMCDVWQAADLVSCTISLYSICAIAFDRWLNLEKPLRIFKRNRCSARRALICVWLLPVLIWTPLMIAFRFKSGPTHDGVCTFAWHPTYIVPIIAVPIFYVPVFVLMIVFIRISFVIRSHLIFLHRHSNQNTTTSLFDFDRSPSGSPLRNTPGSSRQRSVANTPLNGSHVKLNGVYGSNVSLNNCNGNCHKSKPPPLSPIVSVNVYSSSHATKTDLAVDVDALNVNTGPNQSPLAMKVLRERLSPKCDANSPKRNSLFDFNCERNPERSTKIKFSIGPKETTPLIDANSKSDPPTNGNLKRTRGHSIAITSNTKDQPIDLRIGSQIDAFHIQIGARSISPVLSQIEQCKDSKRSASRESDMTNVMINTTVNNAENDQKRSSVTSDTAVFFTKRFLSRRPPPLLRAKTEIVLDTSTRPKPRPSARFSIITLTTPLSFRRYSMNLFSDMFPQCTAGIAQQIRAAKAVGVILIFFLISWAPFLVLWPLKTFCHDCVSDRLYELSIWANYLNSTLNPILYTLCSPRFQRVFRKRCMNGCKPKAYTGTGTSKRMKCKRFSTKGE